MLEELVHIGIDLARERNVAALSRRMLEHARRLTRAETAILSLRERDHLRTVLVDRDTDAASRDRPEMRADAETELISVHTRSAPAYVAATGIVLNIPDARAEDPPRSFPLIDLEIRTALVVPLKDRTR